MKTVREPGVKCKQNKQTQRKNIDQESEGIEGWTVQWFAGRKVTMQW